MISLALLSIIVTIVLSALTKSNHEEMCLKNQIEAYNVAQMAIQSGQDHLNLNGEDILIIHSENKIIIKNKGEEILSFEEKN
nr:competence type IV pilus minor pilin ComGE [Lactococcus hircilactis]